MTILLKRLTVFFINCLIISSLYAHSNLDSLISRTTSQSYYDSIVALNKMSWEIKSKDPQKAINYASQALNLSRIHKYPELEAKSLKHIATGHLMAGNFKKAQSYFETAIQMFSKIDDEKGKSSCYNNLGLCLESLGDFIGATKAYETALKIHKSIGNKIGVAGSLSNIGNIQQKNGNYTKALETYISSLEIREEINDRKGMAVIANNIGAIYEKQAAYTKAIENYKYSLSIYAELNEKRHSAITLNNIGYIHFLQSEYEKSLNYYKQSLEIREEIDDKNGIATIFLNIADLYIKQKEYDKALMCLNKSEKYFNKIGNVYEINKVKITKASYFLRQKNYKHVIALLNSINYKSDVLIEQQELAYKILSKAYFNTGNYRKAFLSQEKFLKLKDSISSNENSKKIIQLQLNYEFDKKQREKEIQREKQKLKDTEELFKRKMTNWVLLIFLFSFVLLSLVIFKSYIRKKKDNKLLLFQKRQIEIINNELVKYQDKLLLERNELEQQKNLITKQKQRITDSLIYAKKIQDSILPNKMLMKSLLKSYFVVYRPKDIVSGDFYWVKQKDNYTFVVAADGAGHGVSGSFTSLLGISFLNEIIETTTIYDSSAIIVSLNKKMQNILQKSDSNDLECSIDMGLCVINQELEEMQFSGLNNSLVIINNNEVSEISGDRVTTGFFQKEVELMSKHKIKIQKGDKFFMYTDGFVDQFGGIYNKKFMASRLQKILLKNSDKSMKTIKKALEIELDIWMNGADQMDDILVLGFTSTV